MYHATPPTAGGGQKVRPKTVTLNGKGLEKHMRCTLGTLYQRHIVVLIRGKKRGGKNGEKILRGVFEESAYNGEGVRFGTELKEDWGEEKMVFSLRGGRNGSF